MAIFRQPSNFSRKKGAASAAKRADRAAKEGCVIAMVNDDSKAAAIVEVNCETDFVGKNAEFEKYSNQVCRAALSSDAATVEDLMKVSVDNDTVEGLHNEILAKFSENIGIRRFEKVTTEGYIEAYIHAGNKLAVLLEVTAAELNDNSKALTRDIAMQIAAMNPMFITRDEVSADVLAKEKEIYIQQAVDSGKPADIAERIAEGKLGKFFQEQCLVEQVFVKDSKKKISDVLKEISNECGSEVKITKFRRYFLGEE